MVRIYILIALISASCFGYAQTADTVQVDLVDVIIGRKKVEATDKIRSERKVYFSVLPAPVTTSGGGKAVVTSINAAFFLGDPATTNLSNIYLVPFTDFSGRYGLYIKPNLWLAKNSWNFIGDYRIARFPQSTWGLGGSTEEIEETLIDTDFIRVHQSALKNIGKNVFAGIGYALDYNYNIEETEYYLEGHLSQYYLETEDPSVSSGITLNVAYDIRYNIINPPKGGYLLASFRVNSKGFGSDHDYQTLFIDARKYIPAPKYRSIFAFRSYYWTLLKGDAPYLHLPATNWAPASGIASRGFQSGRYRSNAMLYGEAEQRFQLTKNGLFGLVGFINVASASEFQTQQFKTWKVGGGIGLRTKFNKFSNANFSLDFGFSENYWSVWINLGEMF